MVEIVRVKNFDELSNDCARRMLECIKENPKANICLASGGSPELAYRLFAKQVIDENIENYVKQINGMVKYCSNKLSGSIDITKLSQATGVSEDFIRTALEIMENIESIPP